MNKFGFCFHVDYVIFQTCSLVFKQVKMYENDSILSCLLSCHKLDVICDDVFLTLGFLCSFSMLFKTISCCRKIKLADSSVPGSGVFSGDPFIHSFHLFFIS